METVDMADRTTVRAHEQRVRRLAQREGYSLSKSRLRGWPIPERDEGDYMLLEVRSNLPVVGARYDASLEEIEAWLTG